jgi:hypothetical protein
MEHRHEQQQQQQGLSRGIRGQYARKGVYVNADGSESSNPEYRKEWVKGQMRKTTNKDGETRFTIQNLTPVNGARLLVLLLLNYVGLFIAGAAFVALVGEGLYKLNPVGPP